MTSESVIVLLIIGAINTGCCSKLAVESEKGGHERMREKTIEQVQEEHTDEWMAIDGVEGTAIGLHEGKPCIKIFTSSKPEELLSRNA